MLTNSCSPSKMTDGWIYLAYCPIFSEMLMNSFGPNVEFSDEQEKRGFSKICENLNTSIEYKDHDRKKEQRRLWKSIKFVDLVRRFPRYTWWLNFNSFCFDSWRSRRRRERVVQILRTHKTKRMSTWREGVRQVTNTVRRNIGAQNVNYGGPVQTFLRADKALYRRISFIL